PSVSRSSSACPSPSTELLVTLGSPCYDAATVRPLLALIILSGCANLLGITDPVAGDGSLAADSAQLTDAGPHTLMAIAISPDPLALPLGITTPLAAIGMYSDGATEDLTARATFTVVSGTAASITSAGVVKALVQGPVSFSATVDAFSDTIEATVGPPEADHLLLTIGNFSLSQQQRVQLHASAVFTDGSTQDATGSVAWSTSAPAVATVLAGQVDAQQQGGDATITASTPGVPPASVVASVSNVACHPVINEVQSGTSASASAEYAEIYNPCTVAIDVTSWSLVYRAATDIDATDTNALITLSGTMAPGELRLFAGSGFGGANDGSWGAGVMQQNNGALGLRNGPPSTGPLVDSMAYGTVTAGHPFVETAASAPLVNGKTLSRLPFDGNDTNAGANFALTSPGTPRNLNAP
ncbi:MAG: LigC protein, partial [Deltaproteobacteria bacterium]|nr:LigC protein [Deltaproteobacteria bacterium]